MAKNKKAEVNIIMLGARRSGKTSVLASMNEIFDNIEGSALVLNQDLDNDSALDEALSGMKNIFSKGKYGNPIFTFNNVRATDVIYQYYFNLSTIDNKKKTKHLIKFTDIPGEWICPYEDLYINDAERNKRKNEVGICLSDSDIIFIAVDSVLLMENEGIYNEIGNECSKITRWLKSQLTESSGKKMIIFVPLKFETYYYSGRANNVVNEIRRVYSSLIQFLTRDQFRDAFYVAITPVLTLGDLIYAGEIVKDGSLVKASYKFRSENAKYNPQFCEQPLIYILSYIYQQMKYNKNGKEKKFKLWWDKFFNEKLHIKNDHLFMKEIEKLQFQKKNGDGFVVLQDSFMR